MKYLRKNARACGKLLACAIAAWPWGLGAGVLDAPECLVPAKAHGGFDLTCKFAGALVDAGRQAGQPLRISYLPGGIGAVAYDRMVTNRLSKPGTLVAFSSGSLLNLAQGKFGPHSASDVRWVAALGADYGAIAVRADSPMRSLGDLVVQLQQDSSRVVFGAGGTVGSQDWVKAALIVNSPTSLVGGNVVVNMSSPNGAPGGWNHINSYTAVVKASAFTAGGGFGSVAVQRSMPVQR